MADILKCKSVWPLQGEPGHQLTQLNSPIESIGELS